MKQMPAKAATLVVVIFLLLGPACSFRTHQTYWINQEPGFLVVAQHQRRTSVITERHDETLDAEVVFSGDDGRFRLNPYSWFWYGTPRTFVTLSKKGFATWAGYVSGHNMIGATKREGGRFRLPRTENFFEEYEAFQQALMYSCRYSEDDACTAMITEDLARAEETSLSAHFADRKRFIRETYPQVFDRQQSHRFRKTKNGRIRISSWRVFQSTSSRPCAISLGPTDSFVVAERRLSKPLVKNTPAIADTPATLRLVDQTNEVVATAALSGWGGQQSCPVLARASPAAFMVSTGREISILSTRDLSRERRIELTPGLSENEEMVSIGPARPGYLVGIRRNVVGGGTVSYCRTYGPDGKMIKERRLSGIEVLKRVASTADGRLIASGFLEGSARDMWVGPLVRNDSYEGVVIYADSAVEKPMVLVEGTHQFAISGDEIWTLIHDLLPGEIRKKLRRVGSPINHQAHRRDVLLRLRLDGSVVEAWDLTDRQLGPQEAEYLDQTAHRLAFVNHSPFFEHWAEIVELDLAKTRTASTRLDLSDRPWKGGGP